MSYRWIHVGILALIVVGAATESPAPFIWRPGQGWKREGSEEIATPEAAWRRAEQLRAEDKCGEAIRIYRSIVKRWPDNQAFAPKAQQGLAECLEREGYLAKAFDAYQTLLDRYPQSVDYQEVLRKQFRVAERLFDGEKQRLWKIRAFPAVEKAADIFRKIVENGPYSDIAPYAQFGIGATYEKEKEYQLAADAYQKVIDQYADSEVAADARFRLGVCYYKLSSEAGYDQDYSREAVAAFAAYLAHHPDHQYANLARQYTAELWNRQAEGVFRIGRFYDTQKQPEAARIYYERVVEEFPDTEWAAKAEEAVRRLARKEGSRR